MDGHETEAPPGEEQPRRDVARQAIADDQDRTEEAALAEQAKRRADMLAWYRRIRAEVKGGGAIAYLHDQLDRERADAYLRLAVVDPEDPKRIRELQNAVWRADLMEERIAAALLELAKADEQARRDIENPPPVD